MLLPEIREGFSSGYEFMWEGQKKLKHLSFYPEHNDPRFQKDFVARLRTATRLFIARTVKYLHKGKMEKAINCSTIAGKYFADYRRHYQHYLSLRAKA